MAKKSVSKQQSQQGSSVKALESLDSKTGVDSGVKIDSRVNIPNSKENTLDERAKAINLNEIINRVAANSGKLKEVANEQKTLGEKFALKTLWILKNHKINVGETVSLIEGRLRATYNLPESSINDNSEVSNFLSACANAKSNKGCGYLRTLLQSCLMLYKNVELDNIEILSKDVRKESQKIRENLTKTLQDKETLYSNMDNYLSAYVRDFNLRNPQAQLTVGKIPNIAEALVEGQRLFLEQQEALKRNDRFKALKEALAGMTEQERQALLN